MTTAAPTLAYRHGSSSRSATTAPPWFVVATLAPTFDAVLPDVPAWSRILLVEDDPGMRERRSAGGQRVVVPLEGPALRSFVASVRRAAEELLARRRARGDMIPILAASLAVSTAHAFEPNREFSCGIGIVYAPHVDSARAGRPHAPAADGLPRRVASRPDQPWAVELQATQRYALGNHCSWNETDCGGGLGGSGIWPLVGPRVALTWRGDTRFGGRVTAFGGFGIVDMHQFGFFPLWEVDGEVGVAGEINTGTAFVLGGEAGRSLSYSERIGEFGTRTYGASMLAARLGAMVHLDPSGFHDPRYRFALEMCTAAGDYI